jgi:hypothetical protein
MWVNTDDATREECITIKVAIRRPAFERLNDNIDTVLGAPAPVVRDGDTLHLSHDFLTHYFGDAEEKLAALDRILSDPDVECVAADVSELRHGRSLVMSVAAQLGSVIETLEAKGV